MTCEASDWNLYAIYPEQVQAKDSLMTSKARGEAWQSWVGVEQGTSGHIFHTQQLL